MKAYLASETTKKQTNKQTNMVNKNTNKTNKQINKTKQVNIVYSIAIKKK